MTALFDTHAHLIAADLDRYPPSPLRGVTELADPGPAITDDMLLGWMEEAGVAQACLVQRGHIHGYDNRYVVDCALRNPDRFVSVGIFDAQDTATPGIVDTLARTRSLAGARLCQVRPWELDTAWLNSPQSIRFWEAANALRLPVAVILFHNQLRWGLPALHSIAEMFPDLPIILDHVGAGHASQPEVPWNEARGVDMTPPGPPDYGFPDYLGRFHSTPNVSFKLTTINIDRLIAGGLDFGAYVRRFTDEFGPDRLIWGSDLGQSGGSYAEMAGHARSAGALLDEAERAKFLFGNAHRVYRERQDRSRAARG